MLSADVLHNIVKAATGTHHTAHQNAHAHNHSDGTAGIGYRNALKATDGSINNYYQAKETQSGYIGKACDCFKKLGCTNELGHHGRAEEGYHHQSGHISQQIGFVTCTQYVDNSYSIDFTGDEGNFFTENAKDEENNNHLHDGHIKPTIANYPSHAGSANEG